MSGHRRHAKPTTTSPGSAERLALLVSGFRYNRRPPRLTFDGFSRRRDGRLVARPL